jgi:hypothetical protein
VVEVVDMVEVVELEAFEVVEVVKVVPEEPPGYTQFEYWDMAPARSLVKMERAQSGM